MACIKLIPQKHQYNAKVRALTEWISNFFYSSGGHVPTHRPQRENRAWVLPTGEFPRLAPLRRKLRKYENSESSEKAVSVFSFPASFRCSRDESKGWGDL